MRIIDSIENLIGIDIKHISFDLWLTLIQSNPNFKNERNKLFKSFFEIKYDLNLVSDKIRYYDVLCNSINEKIGYNIDTFEIYLFILKSLDYDINCCSIDKFEEFYFESEILFFRHEPKFIENNIVNTLIKFQEDSVSLSILSNTGFIKGNTIRKFLRKYDLENLFSFQIYSDECKFSKPNSKIFQLVNDNVIKMDIQSKSDVLHVGDNLIADYEGALEFGFKSYLYKK